MKTTPEPVLETDRLWFRRHTADDIEFYCAMEMDADVRRYTGGRPRTREEAEQRFMPFLAPPVNGLSMWAAILKNENLYVGRCGIYPHFGYDDQPIPGEAALGIYLAKDYWGRGLATEAGREFISYGFNQLGLSKIVTAIQVGNDASVRVIEKLGFTMDWTEEGNLRSFYHFVLEKARYDSF